MGRLLLKALVTIAGAALPTLLARVPLPGWEDPGGSLMAMFQTHHVAIGALGLDAVLLAFVLVELAAAVMPRWRELRRGQGRIELMRVVILAGTVMVVLQAIFVAWSVRAFGLEPFAPGVLPLVLDVAALIGGVLALLGAARAVSRWGLGHGLSVVVVLGALPYWLERGQASAGGDDAEAFARTLVLVAIGAIALVGREVRGERVPVAGLLPLLLPWWIMQAVVLVAVFVPLDALEPLFSPSRAAVFTVVVALALAIPLAAPGGRRVAVMRARAQALALSTAMVAALVAVDQSMWGDVSFLGLGAGCAYFVIAVATTMDVLREASLAGRVELVAVLTFSDVAVADRVSRRLAEADIAHVMRGLGHRTLLRFFGPWVPVRLMIDRSRAEEGLRIARDESNRESYAEIAAAF